MARAAGAPPRARRSLEVIGAIVQRSPSRRQRIGMLAGCLAAVATVAVVDASLGHAYTVSAVYLVPVALAALLVGDRSAYLVAAAAALAWILVDAHIEMDRTLPVSAWNGGSRLLIFVVVVYLLSVLRELVVELAEAEDRTKRFLAAAAHQLRTPLAGLLASAETLAQEPDDAARQRTVENLQTSTERVRRMLTLLLESARLEQLPRSEVRDLDLPTICRRLVQGVVHVREEVSVEYRGPDALTVSSNADVIREAVGNLLDNAVRHAERSVVVEVAAEERVARLRVVDDGPGLPRGEEDRVFERFVTLDGRGGSGLGLALASRMLATVDATLAYESGAFVVRVPR